MSRSHVDSGRLLPIPVRVLLLSWAGLLLSSAPVRATWSIVAIDETTGEVGIAAASCSVGVAQIAGVVPSKGVVAAQAATSFRGKKLALRMIEEGAHAPRVLAALADPEVYDGWLTTPFSELQYGVATLAGDTHAGHIEGDATPPQSGGEAGPGFSVQGNTLRRGVVEATARAYREGGRRRCVPPLAERLLLALEAGRDAGGDARCPASAPSLAAFLFVARPDDGVDVLALELATPRRFSLVESVWYALVPYTPDPARPAPVAELRGHYDELPGARGCEDEEN